MQRLSQTKETLLDEFNKREAERAYHVRLSAAGSISILAIILACIVIYCVRHYRALLRIHVRVAEGGFNCFAAGLVPLLVRFWVAGG